MRKSNTKNKVVRDAGFVRNLKSLAAAGASKSEVADALAINVADLDELLATNPAILAAWREARLKLVLNLKRSLLKAAGEGRVTAIQRIEDTLRAELSKKEGRGKSFDVENLTTGQLMWVTAKSRATLDRWRLDHKLPRSKMKTFNLREFFSWYERFCRSKFINNNLTPGNEDRLRNARARIIELSIARKKAELLDRGEVIAGLIARWQAVIAGLERGIGELPLLLELKNTEEIRQILNDFFREIRDQFGVIPPVLQLPAKAETKLVELFSLLKGEPQDVNKSGTRKTESKTQ